MVLVPLVWAALPWDGSWRKEKGLMKERPYRRPLALILSLCLVLTLFGGVSFATEGNGSKPESFKDSGTLALPEYQAPLGDGFPIVDSAAHLVITKWEWVDDAQFLTWDEGRGAYTLSVPTDPENPVDKALVLDYLPTEIKATLADGTEKVLGVVWDETNLDIIDGRAWAAWPIAGTTWGRAPGGLVLC